MSAPIRIHNTLTPQTALHLPAHEQAARRARVQAAALPGIPGSRPPRVPKPPVPKGRKTETTRNLALPPLGYGLSPVQV